ncbi:helix-turn-helix transcriptional regulator [Kitasatospora kazusensis]|uniref:Helix-turn-helix transcriptional regulator n=1 Tax=Kitasatospora kazusensis TaxID=407974 RepID=A0ABN2ZH36_9ACTN
MAGRKNELDPSDSPGSLFGGMLRMFRESRNLSQQQLAAEVPCDDSFISRVESGTRAPKDGFAERCDEILKTGGALAFLMPFVQKQLEATFREGFLEYVEEEAKAVELRTFEVAYIPGLLQTEAFARALLTEGGVRRAGALRAADVHETVELWLARRLDRQRILTSETPPFLFVVIDESVLLRPVGGKEVMRAQCDHLLAMTELPNVALQIAPLSLGDRLPMAAPLTLLTLPGGSVTVYSESVLCGLLVRDKVVIENAQHKYTLLQIEALSQDASVDLIRQVRQELYS